MIRTQVQLTEKQIIGLRQLSAATGKSTAELIRNGIDEFLLARRVVSARERVERAIHAAGRFASGSNDTSADHDRYLAQAIRE